MKEKMRDGDDKMKKNEDFWHFLTEIFVYVFSRRVSPLYSRAHIAHFRALARISPAAWHISPLRPSARLSAHLSTPHGTSATPRSLHTTLDYIISLVSLPFGVQYPSRLLSIVSLFP